MKNHGLKNPASKIFRALLGVILLAPVGYAEDVIVPGADTDGDGLSDADEVLYGTRWRDPDADKDSDGDGVEDGADGWAKDPALSPPRLPEQTYTVVVLPTGTGGGFIGFSDDNTVLLGGSDYNGSAWNPDRGTVSLNFSPNSISRSGQYACGDGKPEFVDNGFGDLVQDLTKPIPLYRKDLWSAAPSVRLAKGPKYPFSGKESKENPDRGIATATTVNSSGTTLGHYADERGAEAAGSGYNFIARTLLDNYTGIVTGKRLSGPVFIPREIADDGMAVGLFSAEPAWSSGLESVFQHVRTAGISPPSKGIQYGAGFDGLNSAKPTRGIIGYDGRPKLWLMSVGGAITGTSIARAPLGEVFPGGSNDFAYDINNNFQITGQFTHGGKTFSLVHNGMLTNPKASDPDWTVKFVHFINNSGVMVAQATYKKETAWKKVLLVPAAMVTDANRDGKIDSADSGQITPDDPWHFWVNDDDDSGDTGGEDIPGNGSNFRNVEIDGTRDLVDFFPLHLDIKALLQALPAGKHIYKLKQKGGTLNFSYTDLKLGTVGDYLKNTTEGEALDNAPALGKATTIRITAAGVELSADRLKKIKDEDKSVILLEGRAATKAPLVLEVTKKDGGTKLVEIKFPLEISGVEQMFRHRNLLAAGQMLGWGEVPPPLTETTNDRLGQPDNYPDKLNGEKNFICLHGYNTNQNEARGWHAEMFKRLFWSGSRAKFTGVTWWGYESQGSIPLKKDLTPNYHVNVGHAFATAPALSAFLASLPGEKIVAAHSLGNMVTLAALHDVAAPISKYFMLNAAVAIEALDPAADINSTGNDGNQNMLHVDWIKYAQGGDREYDKLFASEWHTLFPSNDGRSRLTWRGRFQKALGLTTLYNFYSVGDEVFRAHPATDKPTPGDAKGPPVGVFSWALQEKLKGRMGVEWTLPSPASSYGGWGFDKKYANFRRLGRESFIQLGWLLEAPFFRTGTYPGDVAEGRPDDLDRLYHKTKGSAYATRQFTRLLAQMIPSRTLALGGHPVNKEGRDPVIAPKENEINMEAEFKKNGWPVEDKDPAGNWSHSDLKAVSYPYTWKMYEKMVELGELKK